MSKRCEDLEFQAATAAVGWPETAHQLSLVAPSFLKLG